ncbi:uncharacterized protein ATNIH1004_001696 [Aspergillus tanneri]|uniref:Uncharacterized protein n=1 Tax=Aspergillus tanneri TaxID=1220188 RepID=A0A5M9N076_9EURO|nr:uncharacterized protein ATNIH1004_001696 [Aspergillus tanneri]KAA8652791.1 hypothetical protein ATNIH1004_001696 [Aspergillus tanneri]
MDFLYKLFGDLPEDIWYDLRDLPSPIDVENSAPALWSFIFKDTTWLDLALTYDRCLPVLVGRDLSSFRPLKPLNRLYITLLASDHSSDLRYKEKEFFDSLQDRFKYNKEKYELHFPSGITVNIYEVITGHDVAYVPLKRLFSRKNGLELQYHFYQGDGLKVLKPPNIIGIGGPAEKWGKIKHGCALNLHHHGMLKQYMVVRRGSKLNLLAEAMDKSTNTVSSYCVK